MDGGREGGRERGREGERGGWRKGEEAYFKNLNGLVANTALSNTVVTAIVKRMTTEESHDRIDL